MLGVGQRQQLLANPVAVAQREVADAADLVAALAALDAAGLYRVVPLVVAVEVAQHGPDALDRRIDDRRADDSLKHQRPPKWRFSASKPPWNTLPPIESVSSRSRPGRAVELGAPFGEAARAVGHRRQLQGRGVVLDVHRALENLVGAAVLVVR
jgi:hypothetical protein